MKYEIVCPKCLRPMIQVHERLNAKKVQTISKCVNDECGYVTGFIMDLKQILQDSPQLKHQLEMYNRAVVIA